MPWLQFTNQGIKREDIRKEKTKDGGTHLTGIREDPEW